MEVFGQTNCNFDDCGNSSGPDVFVSYTHGRRRSNKWPGRELSEERLHRTGGSVSYSRDVGEDTGRVII